VKILCVREGNWSHRQSCRKAMALFLRSDTAPSQFKSDSVLSHLR
jgi:hypothetical protein